MKEFFLKHGNSVTVSLHDVLESLLPLIFDDVRKREEKRKGLASRFLTGSFDIFLYISIAQKYDDVRSQLILTLKMIIPLVQKSHLFPFLHLIATFVATGMSHIREPIRLSALNTLDIWLDMFPEACKISLFYYSPKLCGIACPTAPIWYL